MFEDIINAFKKKNIDVIAVKTSEEACTKILEMIPLKSKVGYSGSMTLEKIGILNKLRNHDCVFYDRDKVTKYTKDSYQLGHLAQHADYFLSSSNAITKDGKIVNRDKTGNRVSSMIYGPEHVIIVVGKNKIVKDYDAAIERIRNVAAPMNAKRLKLNTPCVKTGKCMDCLLPESICCSTVIIDKQVNKERLKIILVDEELGY
ncbi:lactate utilization protein [Candidatus Woesearchaeota archaeon]|nr:lactate utilization protein [Candidatus Woesearchaeota archaeon]